MEEGAFQLIKRNNGCGPITLDLSDKKVSSLDIHPGLKGHQPSSKGKKVYRLPYPKEPSNWTRYPWMN